MQRSGTIVLALGLAVVACAEARAQRGRGGGGPPSPDRMFEFMDSNRNGALDADEIERLPGPMRGFVQQSGLAGSGGSIRREDFMQRAPQMMEFMRARREEEERRGGFGGFSPDGNRFQGSSRDGERGSSAPSGGRNGENNKNARPRITVDLPDDFRERDLNGDGQIALHEWRIWKRTALAEFAELDRNHDGFLVPRELVQTEGDKPQSTSPSSGRLVVVGRTQSSSDRSDSRSSNDDRRGDSSSDSDDPEARRAETYFGYLDRNRDGRLTEDEWSSSRRLRPMFEDAGVNLSREMSRDQFVQTYLRIAPGG